jgi:hypothetical protein
VKGKTRSSARIRKMIDLSKVIPGGLTVSQGLRGEKKRLDIYGASGILMHL